MSLGTIVPGLIVELCLLVARGVISLSFSPFLAGVDGTFKGSAEEGIPGDGRTCEEPNMSQTSHWLVKIIYPNDPEITPF